jgi:hypothetical protein
MPRFKFSPYCPVSVAPLTNDDRIYSGRHSRERRGVRIKFIESRQAWHSLLWYLYWFDFRYFVANVVTYSESDRRRKNRFSGRVSLVGKGWKITRHRTQIYSPCVQKHSSKTHSRRWTAIRQLLEKANVFSGSIGMTRIYGSTIGKVWCQG